MDEKLRNQKKNYKKKSCQSYKKPNKHKLLETNKF